MCWAVRRVTSTRSSDWGSFNDLGLQASGSNTVEMHRRFIPKHG